MKLTQTKLLLVIAAFFLAMLAVLPFMSILLSWGEITPAFWSHIWQSTLSRYVLNTVYLVLFVSLGAGIVGVVLAMLVSFFDFPGRNIFRGLCYGPLLFPPYVLGFVLLGLFDYSSVAASFMRKNFASVYSILPEFNGFLGAGVSLLISLFPYVFMLAKFSFESQGVRTMEAGRSLGSNMVGCLFRIALPLALPSVVAGMVIVAMEVGADFGTVSVFSYDTFTVGIFKSWYSFFNLKGASQLASLLLGFMLMLHFIRQGLEKKNEFYQAHAGRSVRRYKLGALSGSIVSIGLSIFFVLILLLPLVQLFYWVAGIGPGRAGSLISYNLLNSGVIGLLASIAIVVICVALTASFRQLKKSFSRRGLMVLTQALSLPVIGYAFPGAVLAVGLFIPFALVDHLLLAQGLTQTGVLSQSILVLLMGLFLRFYAVGYAAISNAFRDIPTTADEASFSLNVIGFDLFRKIHFPLIRKPVVWAFVFCFIDVVKEMPLTLMLRPMNWDTLSVKIYEWTSEGEWEKASLPALILVMLGIVPLVFLIKNERKL